MKHKYLVIAFVVVVTAALIVSGVGIFSMSNQPLVLQGEIEATEIRISGKLPGRIDTFYVAEGQSVRRGDTLVRINSPEAYAKLDEVQAMQQVAEYQNIKVDNGTRKQVIASLKQLWDKGKADLELAKTTYNRVEALFKDSVVTSQRRDEVLTLYKSAQAGERAAYYQYQMALDGAQWEDKESARSLVEAAGGAVQQVQSLLKDAHLTAPEDGQISDIFPKRGELLGAGVPIMNLIVLDNVHLVLNVREDLMPHFRMEKVIYVDVPAINQKNLPFKINYISPLGSFATWRSTKQSGSYDLRTFEIHALPTSPVPDLRPGMSILLTIK